MGCSVGCLRGLPRTGTLHNPDEAEEPDLETHGRGRLSETQSRVMADARRRAKRASDAALSELEDRFEKLGYNQEDLDCALRYFREEAPIIIHFNPHPIVNMGWLSDRTVLDSFLKDTHYRSVFKSASREPTQQTDRKRSGRSFWGSTSRDRRPANDPSTAP